MSDEHPHLKFLIAGEGPSRKELERLIANLNLSNRVRLLGSVSHIAEFLRTLDIAVLCSSSEGFPNSIVEYMAAARPIVATNVGGIPELIKHNEHGLLVEPDRPSELANAISQLLSDPNQAAHMANNARQRATAEFDLKINIARHQHLYEFLLNGRMVRQPDSLNLHNTKA